MKTLSNIGVINCGHGDSFYEARNNVELHARIAKVYAPKKHQSVVNTHYPEAEIVQEMTLLLHDDTIDHVIISEPSKEDLHLVAKVLQAGKKVQIVSR